MKGMTRCLNNHLYVKFDADHLRKFQLPGGITLIRPDEWERRDSDGNIKDTREENTNYLETKPQICEVLAANPSYPYAVGDSLFVHYMAWVGAQCGDLVEQTGFINADYVFFTIEPDGKLKCADDVYLGEMVVGGEEISPSGILVSMGKKDSLRVTLTHIPNNSHYDVGDTVISIDRYNYEFDYNGKKMVKLKLSEIAGKVEDAPIETLVR